MALLLAMYQKMRLIREKNQLVLDQTKVSSKLSRVQKNIERTQKRYTSLFAQLDQQAKYFTTNGKAWIQGNLGITTNINPMNFIGGLGQLAVQAAAGFINNATGAEGSPIIGGTKDNPMYLSNIGEEKFNTLLQYYQSNYGQYPKVTKDADGNVTVQDSSGNTMEGITENDVASFRAAIMQGQQYEKGVNWQSQQMGSALETNVSIWLEAAKTALEEEQDAMLEPLNYEQTMLELEKEQKDTRLQRINEEIETYKQLCSQEVKNATPTFGLG